MVDAGAETNLPPKGMSTAPAQAPKDLLPAVPTTTGASDWLVGPVAGLVGGLFGAVLLMVLGPSLEQLRWGGESYGSGRWRLSESLLAGLYLALVAVPAGFAVLAVRSMTAGDFRPALRKGAIGAAGAALAALLAGLVTENLFYTSATSNRWETVAYWVVLLTLAGMLFGVFATWFGAANRAAAALGRGALGGFLASLPALLVFANLPVTSYWWNAGDLGLTFTFTFEAVAWTVVLGAAVGAGLGLVLPALTRRERTPRYAMVATPGFVPVYAVPVPAGSTGPVGAAVPGAMPGMPVTGYVAAPVSTNGLAVAAMVFGIVGGVVLAIIFGFVAKSQIRRSGGLQRGEGMATAGIVLGFVWLGLWIVFYAVLFGIASSSSSNAIGASW